MPAKDYLERQLARDMGRCIADFGLVEAGDRIMVCVSGGKDSYALLHLLQRAARRAPVRFELIAVHLDQGHPGYDGAPLEAYLKGTGVPFRLIHRDTYTVVRKHIPEGKTACSLCSRLRRGVLYDLATELQCTKIALGHHADDAMETLMMNMMFNGALGAMPPKLQSDDGRHVVIRPLLYCAEKDLAAFAEQQAFPILPCDLCGSQPNLWRQEVKGMLNELEGRVPQLRRSMLRAMTNVRPAHLMDKALLEGAGVPVGQVELDDSPAPAAAPGPVRAESAVPPSRRLPLLR